MNYELWTMEGCFACEMTKEVFAEKNISFAEKQLFRDFTFEELKEKTGKGDIPAVFIDGEYVGGCDWISEHIIKETA